MWAWFIYEKRYRKWITKKQIVELEKENSKLRKQQLKAELKYQLLEKCMPSCTKMTKNQILVKTSTKAWKNRAFIFIHKNISDKSLTIKEKCEALYVAKGSYYRWIERNSDLINKNIYPEIIRKYSINAVEHIQNFIKLFGFAGSGIISKWISDNTQDNVSSKVINELKKSKKINIRYINRSKKQYAKQRGNVVGDLIKNDYISNYLMEKIGVDGSHMDLIIDNNPLQIVGEFAYDWYSRKMIAHKFDLTENS